MGELFVEEGTIPGDSPHTLTGADGTIWHPTGRWAATVVRLCGGIASSTRENNFNPVAFLQFNKDSPDQYPVQTDRRRSLGGRLRQDLLARTRDRLLAGRPLPVHDEQPARKQLLRLRRAAIPIRPSGRRSPTSRIRCGAASIPTRSTWSSRSTVRSSTSRSCIRRRRRAASWWSTPRRGRSRRRSRASVPTCRPRRITYDGKYVLVSVQRLPAAVERHRRHRYRDR